MSATETQERLDSTTRTGETHIACIACNPDRGLCGFPRSQAFLPDDAEVTCVICADLDRTHACFREEFCA